MLPKQIIFKVYTYKGEKKMSIPSFDCYLTLVCVGQMKCDWKKDGETIQRSCLGYDSFVAGDPSGTSTIDFGNVSSKYSYGF